MKVNELRIGNFIAYEPTIDDWEEIYVKPGTIIQCEISPDSFEPIPLTEKWLIDFSFKGRLDFKWNNNVGIQIIDGKYYFAFKDLSNVLFHSVIECKYVHQLQNLYFALTGEELIVF